ncbi:MAG: hypothetical protein RL329_4023 [Bacteroidota bacterium]|jgi:hypothetical protein
MNKPLHIFERLDILMPWGLIVSVVLALLSFGLARFYVQKLNLDYNRRQVVRLLLLFAGATASFSAIFRGVSLLRLTPVCIYADATETPYGKVAHKDLADFYIKLEMRTRPMQPDVPIDSTKFLHLIEKTGKTHILSAGDYPIDSILAKLNIVLGY